MEIYAIEISPYASHSLYTYNHTLEPDGNFPREYCAVTGCL